jgi:hypothetical protein
MLLNGPRLPDGRRQPRDADLDERLVVVIGHKVGSRDDGLDALDDRGKVVDDVVVLQAEQVARL